jgi:DNA-binding PadR family transcriptional regulator
MTGRGRPLKTEIREKIASILMHSGQSYGYEIYKSYLKVFGKISLRNLYYNIKKGLELGEFIISDIKREVGAFTWGAESQRIYYTMGPYAKTYAIGEKQNEVLAALPQKEVKIDFDKEVMQKISELETQIQKFKAEQARIKYEDKTKFRSSVKHRIDMLKEWMTSKFDKQKAHELHVKLDLMFAQLNP